MTIDGEFVAPPTPPVTSRILMWAVVVAVVAGALAFAAFALWLALLILPSLRIPPRRMTLAALTDQDGLRRTLSVPAKLAIDS